MRGPTTRDCELGPIRPPSEASSLLLRVTRNCPWNDCQFCAVYKGTRFERRSTEALLADIDRLAEDALAVRRRAAAQGQGDRVSQELALKVLRDPEAREGEKRMALWLERGAEHVFLQDADSLVLPSARLVPVLEHLYRRFPSITRVTTYARSRTLAARSQEQLSALRAAGLTRIHVGLESGSDAVLADVVKGCRAVHHVKGCRAAIASGFEVCCYVMPGLGGRNLSAVHAAETARVLREIAPQHIRLRTLWLDQRSPLHSRWQQGAFQLQEDEDTVSEILALVRGLQGLDCQLVSDHDRNLLSELEGHLTRDAGALVQQLTDYLALPRATKDAFSVARRAGYARSLPLFLANSALVQRFAALAGELRIAGSGSLIDGLARAHGPRSI